MSENNLTDVSRTNMMSSQETEVVKAVYNRFISCEETDWSRLDDLMEYMEYLTDSEIVNESEVQVAEHLKKGIKCNLDHSSEYCFAPSILESAQAIISLFHKTKNLHPKNRYILSYYMTLCELQLVLSGS